MKTRRSVSTGGLCLVLAAWAGGASGRTEVRAQGTCDTQFELRAHWDQFVGSYADVWGEANVAYVGTFFDNIVHFFDVSDPANPVRFEMWAVPAPNQFASAQDVKVANGLLFVALDSNGGDGVEIVDVRDPFNPQHLTWIDTPGFPDVHNTFYDSGMLYLADSRSPQVAVVDLTGYDPDNPPARIETNRWLFQVGASFVHDITVQNGVLYVAAWNSGLYLYDVTDVADQPPILLGSGPPSSATHSVWPSADGRWAVVGEERFMGPLRLYEIIPNASGVDVVLRDSLVIPGAFSIHNPIVIGTRVYASWYEAGTRILDIDEDNAAFVEVASFDSYLGGAGGGFGTWGVYPLLGPDRILASDNANGLFVLAATGMDCDDGLFCNGLEVCDNGQCAPGPDPCPGLRCRESDDQCVQCLEDADCDNGVFCDGAETCDASGTCQAGSPPCTGRFCVESQDRCVDCLGDQDCDDADFCTRDRCVNDLCNHDPILYGDVNVDGLVDIFDIFCVLDGFQSVFDVCPFAAVDIAGCDPDGIIDINDIFAVLDAFVGAASCCDQP